MFSEGREGCIGNTNGLMFTLNTLLDIDRHMVSRLFNTEILYSPVRLFLFTNIHRY